MTPEENYYMPCGQLPEYEKWDHAQLAIAAACEDGHIEALVTAAYELGVADEREECARLCEVHQYEWAYGSTYAAAIRNRSAS